MDLDVEDQAASRQMAQVPRGPMLKSEERRRLAAWLWERFGPWSGGEDLAGLAQIAIEPTRGVPSGVVVRRGVVYLELDVDGGERDRLATLGVAAALLAEFYATFSLEDVDPFAAALMALVGSS